MSLVEDEIRRKALQCAGEPLASRSWVQELPRAAHGITEGTLYVISLTRHPSH